MGKVSYKSQQVKEKGEDLAKQGYEKSKDLAQKGKEKAQEQYEKMGQTA